MLGTVTQLHLGLIPWAGNMGHQCSLSHEGNLLELPVGLGISLSLDLLLWLFPFGFDLGHVSMHGKRR